MGRKPLLVITFQGEIGQGMRPLPPYNPATGPESRIQWPIEVSVTPMNLKTQLGDAIWPSYGVEERVAYP